MNRNEVRKNAFRVMRRFATIKTKLNHCVRTGVNQGQRDGVGGRRGLLSSVQRDDFGGERGECSSIDPVTGSNHVAERVGHEAFARDPQRPRRHSEDHASAVGRGHRVLGHQSGARRNVRTREQNFQNPLTVESYKKPKDTAPRIPPSQKKSSKKGVFKNYIFPPIRSAFGKTGVC